MDAIGRGDTAAAAVRQLRDVLLERLDRPYAVAPPADQEPVHIDLVPVDEAFPSMLDEEELPA